MRHRCCLVGTAHVPRVRTAFRTLSLRIFDRLDCAANAKMYIGILCILATSGGVLALT